MLLYMAASDAAMPPASTHSGPFCRTTWFNFEQFDGIPGPFCGFINLEFICAQFCPIDDLYAATGNTPFHSVNTRPHVTSHKQVGIHRLVAVVIPRILTWDRNVIGLAAEW